MRRKRARVYLMIIIALAIFSFAKADEFSPSEQFSMRLDELFAIGVRRIDGKTMSESHGRQMDRRRPAHQSRPQWKGRSLE